MRTSVGLFLLLSACGTDATVSGVFPAEGFTGRSLRVEISGDATEWSGAVGVSLGQGVTVSSVTVASPTSLFADITVNADATPGLTDVTVTNDGTFMLEQSFEVRSPIALAFDGQVAEGGAPYFTISNRDFDTPFDLTQANGSFANLLISSPPGVTFQIDSATPYQLKGFALIDADATPGSFAISSGLPGKETPFNLGTIINVAARTPVPLTDMASGTLADVGDSVLYSINVAQVPALVRETTTASNMDAEPVAYLLPNGHWAESIRATLAVLQSAGTYAVVVVDNGTAANYNFSLRSRAELLTSGPEASESNATTTGATVASMLPFTQTGGTIASAPDHDWIRVTLTAAAMLHIRAQGPNDFTDTAVDILDGTGASVISGPVDDATCGFFEPCGEEFTSPMLAAGTYYVDVFQGATAFDASFNKYTALVYIE